MVHNIPITMIAAVGKTTLAIGKENNLLWHVPDDLKRFKTLTLGKPIIMGRKTFESIIKILGKPLPGRTNIVVTRNPHYRPAGATVANSLTDALNQAQQENPTEICIGGGGEIYRQALPYADRLHITWFTDDTIGDTTFPAFADEFTIATAHPAQEYNGLEYQWIDYIRT